jgi:hypothetical protein
MRASVKIRHPLPRVPRRVLSAGAHDACRACGSPSLL